jgi:hypothetical protein
VTTSAYARRFAGRWQARAAMILTDVPVGPLHSTPRPACTLMSGEHVLVDGCWRQIAEARRLREPGEPAQTLLHLSDGQILASGFDHLYVSRDADEQLAAGGAL